jgi:putative membrane protein
MGRLSRIILWFFLLLIFIASIAFSMINSTAVPLSFGVIVLSPQPISVWVIAAFCLGALCGLILGASLLKSRLKVRQLNRELLKRELQIQRLNAPEQKVTVGR